MDVGPTLSGAVKAPLCVDRGCTVQPALARSSAGKIEKRRTSVRGYQRALLQLADAVDAGNLSTAELKKLKSLLEDVEKSTYYKRAVKKLAARRRREQLKIADDEEDEENS